jgi:acyl carrier protein
MNEAQARAVVVAALTDVAPELDADGIDPQASLRDGADLDSMDFQAFVAAVAEAIGADIPEADYRQLDGLAKAADYVAAHG